MAIKGNGWYNNRTVRDKIMAVLSDGNPHTIIELADCLADEYTGFGAVATHICALRPVLERKGMDIVKRNGYYRLVRFLTPDD